MPSCVTCGADLAEGARFCANCGTAVVTDMPRERRLVTLLFGDLVGSTAAASGADVEVVRDRLERFYDAMTAEITAFGGTLEKFIGDAVVAVFGAPVALEDHAERALDAALAMQERMHELFGDGLALRIGVNTGDVVVGRAHGGGSFASGDAVNVAARLEQNADRGKVLVGERTIALAENRFIFGDTRRFEAKGKADGVVGAVLKGRRPGASGRARGALPSVFVGRREELHWLSGLLDSSLSSSAPRSALVVGEPGVGKSSVVETFLSTLPDGVTALRARCVSYGRHAAYSPLADILRTALGLEEQTPVDVALGRLPSPDLGVVIGAPPTTEEPLAAAERLRVAWVGFVDQLAAGSPLVLLVEDLHWAGPLVVQALQRVLDDVRRPVLLVGTTRPEALELPTGERRELGPLNPDEVTAMVHALLDDEGAEEVADIVAAQADGNALFVEEILQSLIDAGRLYRSTAGWALRKRSTRIDVPDSLRGLLAARIDRVPPVERQILQAAAVVGREFTRESLEPLVDLGTIDVDPLLRRDLIRKAEGARLTFKHALTRAAAYDLLPRAQRARLHVAYATWLERTSGGEAPAATLAGHYARAADPDVAELVWRGREQDRAKIVAAALHWLGRAADAAIAIFDVDAALNHLHDIARLTPDDPCVWQRVGRVNAMKYDGEAFWTAMLHAAELTDQKQLLAELYSELVFQSTYRGAMWREPPENSRIEDWIKQALDNAEPGSREEGRVLAAQSMRDDETPSKAFDQAARALAIGEALSDAEVVSYALGSYWCLNQVAGSFQEAYEWSARRVQSVAALTDLDAIAQTYQAASTAALAVCRFDEAHEHVAALHAASGRLTPHHAIHVLASELILDEALGDWAAVRRLEEKSRRAVVDNGDTPCVFNSRILLTCALAAASAGDERAAVRLERESDEAGMGKYGMWLDPLRAELAIVRGALDELDRLLETKEQWTWPVFTHAFGAAARLDACLVRGLLDAAVELAAPLADSPHYLQPFAMRTLGIARADHAAVKEATELFRQRGMRWQVEHTARLRRLCAA